MSRLLPHKFYQAGVLMSLLMPILFLIGCVSVNKKTNADTRATYSSFSSDQGQGQNILLGFTLVENPERDSVYIHYQRLNKGSITEHFEHYEMQEGDLVIQFVSAEGNVIKTVEVKDPSRRLIETFSESGDLEVDTEDLSSSEFFIRLNYSQDLAIARIYRIQKTGSRKMISSLIIQQG